jgi:AcrR family transcriptional regulator
MTTLRDSLTSTTTYSPAASRVLDAALDLFYVQGFRSTSVRDIMNACQLTSGALYNHFESKDSLLYEIARATHDLCDEYLYRGIAQANEPRGQLWHLTYAISEFHAACARQAHITSVEFRELHEPKLSDIRERRRRVLLMFENVLVQGIESGDFEAPRTGDRRAVRLYATAITNMAIRISEWYSPGAGLSLQEIASLHGDIAIRMTKRNGETEFANHRPYSSAAAKRGSKKSRDTGLR